MYAVHKAHEIAAAAEANLVMVTASIREIQPSNRTSSASPAAVRKEAARDAMRRTVTDLTSDRIRSVDQDIVAADPWSTARSCASEPRQPDHHR